MTNIRYVVQENLSFGTTIYKTGTFDINLGPPFIQLFGRGQRVEMLDWVTGLNFFSSLTFFGFFQGYLLFF